MIKSWIVTTNHQDKTERKAWNEILFDLSKPDDFDIWIMTVSDLEKMSLRL
jgi:hypothetical protein